MPSLAVVQTNSLNVALEVSFTQLDKCRGRVGDWEKFFRGLVDADIRCLSRQYDGDEKFEWAAMLQFGRWTGVSLSKPAVNGSAFLAVHCR